MTIHPVRIGRAVAPVLGLLLLAGCAAEFQDTEAVAAAARDRASRDWKLALDFQGQAIEFPLERLDIFLFDTDDPERWPETFELRGDGVTLVGILPVGAQVGYGEALENLVGKSVAIGARGGDPHDEKHSSIRLAGVRAPVAGGSITFRKVTGHWSGSEGDRTVWGTVRIEVQGADGLHTLEGAFAANVVSWG